MTKLLYIQNMQQYSCTSKIIKSGEIEGKQYLILDQTIFYPQGGGQPSDIGTIRNDNGTFVVDKTVMEEFEVIHFGHTEKGVMNTSESVEVSIDQDRRVLNSKIHSAGHVIDLAIQKLYPKFKPNKGYHYPEGPHLEYSNPDLEELNTEEYLGKIQTEANKIIALDLEITFTANNQLHTSNKPLRIMHIEGFTDCPCGGTHVSRLKEIGEIIIRKVSNKKGIVKVAYAVRF